MPAYIFEIIVVALGLVLLLIEAFVPKLDKSAIAYSAIGVLGVVFLLLFTATQESADYFDFPEIGRFYSYDNSALFYKGIALLTTIIVLIMSLDYSKVIRGYAGEHDKGAGLGEFYALPVFACAGLMWMASAIDLISIFVALELTTITFYILVSFMRRNVGSLEAGVKYLILGALSTGFLVYGIAWVYGVTGTTELAVIQETALAELDEGATGGLLFGLALILVALGFKIAAFPFQIWVPDVYQGAPLPITAFLSVASKAAGFIVLLRIFQPFAMEDSVRPILVTVFIFMAVATILYGNLAAIAQTNLKRLLGYSSISHAGFLLLGIAGIAATDPETLSGSKTVAFYLGGYLLMTLLAFMVLCIIRCATSSEELRSLNGLGKRSPFLAFALLVAVASLVGVPLTAGFFGKLLVFTQALNAELYSAVVLSIVGIGASFYYYFKIIRAMYWDEPDDSNPDCESNKLSVSPLAKAVIIALMIATILFGVYPTPLLALI